MDNWDTNQSAVPENKKRGARSSAHIPLAILIALLTGIGALYSFLFTVPQLYDGGLLLFFPIALIIGVVVLILSLIFFIRATSKKQLIKRFIIIVLFLILIPAISQFIYAKRDDLRKEAKIKEAQRMRDCGFLISSSKHWKRCIDKVSATPYVFPGCNNDCLLRQCTEAANTLDQHEYCSLLFE